MSINKNGSCPKAPNSKMQLADPHENASKKITQLPPHPIDRIQAKEWSPREHLPSGGDIGESSKDETGVSTANFKCARK